MTALLLLLAIIGGVLVGDLVVENTAAGAVTVLNHPIAGFSDGLLLAAAAALGFVVGLLVVGAVGLRRTRRARRRQLRTAERDLSRQLIELERENARLRETLARRDPPGRHAVALATAERASSPSPADRPREPVFEEAKRAAGLRSDPDLWFLSTDDQTRG
jgi:uncharacterized membrane protein YccC